MAPQLHGTEHELKKLKTEYFPAFDYIRIILASVVTFSHTAIFAFDIGNFSVQVFFAMSGWLIGGILLDTQPSDLPRFYFNRAARIWIPYYTAIILLIIAYVATVPITQKWLELNFYKFTFVFNYFGIRQPVHVPWNGNHFWSICAEEQFYLIAPILISVFKVGRSPWLWLALFAFFMTSDDWNFFASISLGVLAATLQRRIGDWHHVAWVTCLIATAALTIFLVMLLGLIPYWSGASIDAILIVLLFSRPGKKSAFSDFIGGVSYPMYLNHWIGIWLATFCFKRMGFSQGIPFQISCVIGAFLVAAALYILIDRPLRSKRSEYFTARRGVGLAAAGYILVLTGTAAGLSLLDQWGK